MLVASKAETMVVEKVFESVEHLVVEKVVMMVVV